MMRLYKSYLGRLLLGLLILIELEKESGKDAVVAAASKWQPPDENARHSFYEALNIYADGYADETPSNDDVLKGTLGQLQKRKTDDGDLLDLVVQALRLPFGSYWSGAAIKQLREAILTPSELTEVRKAFKSTARCTCGYEFHSNELMSITVQDGSIVLHCNKCARPTYVRCDYCDEVVPMSTKLATTMRNEVDCGCRKRKEATGAAVNAAQADVNAQIRIMRRMQREAAMLTGTGMGRRNILPADAPRATVPAPTPPTEPPPATAAIQFLPPDPFGGGF